MPVQHNSSRRDPVTGLTTIEEQVLALYDGGATPRAQLARAINCTRETISNVLSRPHMIKALQDRSVLEKLAPLIASRKELQIHWTETLRDESRADKERLKASEYLAKSYGMFLDRTETKTVVAFEDQLKALAEEPKQEMDFSDL